MRILTQYDFLSGDRVVTISNNEEGVVRGCSDKGVSVQHVGKVVVYDPNEIKLQTFENFIWQGYGNRGWGWAIILHLACIMGAIATVASGAAWVMSFIGVILFVEWFGQWKQYKSKWV